MLSCGRPVDSDGLIGQKVFFEVSYLNYAWGYQLRGFYIDYQGNVYKYNHSDERWETARSDTITEAELLEKYSHEKELIAKIPCDTLLQKCNMIQAASEGELSEKIHRCYDAGALSYLAYTYHAKNKEYTPVLLYLAGDVAQKNLSEAAQLLFDWLKAVDPRYGNPLCGFPDE